MLIGTGESDDKRRDFLPELWRRPLLERMFHRITLQEIQRIFELSTIAFECASWSTRQNLSQDRGATLTVKIAGRASL